MSRGWMAAIRQWLSPGQGKQESDNGRVDATRRGFFTRAAVGAVSVSGAAGLAKAVVDAAPEPDLKDQYVKDGLVGEQELMGREYVVMSDQEKSDMVQSFIVSHSEQTGSDQI